MADVLRSVLLFRRSSRCSAGGCVEVAMLPDGGVIMRGSKDHTRFLICNKHEWFQFVSGAKSGEFDH
jgi:hypothetical protein